MTNLEQLENDIIEHGDPVLIKSFNNFKQDYNAAKIIILCSICIAIGFQIAYLITN